jgi:hypothetical protein
MLKWIAIFSSMVFGFLITLLGLLMLLYGVLSFLVTFKRNDALNIIGHYCLFIAIPIIILGGYILRRNGRYITGKESWYR